MSHMAQPATTAAADLLAECRAMADRAKAASRSLALARGEAKNRWLLDSAGAIGGRSSGPKRFRGHLVSCCGAGRWRWSRPGWERRTPG